MEVYVPAEDTYSIISYRGKMRGWTEAGVIHGSVIEFQVERKRVRIECNRPIVDSDRLVFVMRRP